MGLLEGYFVPLYNFFLTPENFDQKVQLICFLYFVLPSSAICDCFHIKDSWKCQVRHIWPVIKLWRTWTDTKPCFQMSPSHFMSVLLSSPIGLYYWTFKSSKSLFLSPWKPWQWLWEPPVCRQQRRLVTAGPDGHGIATRLCLRLSSLRNASVNQGLINSIPCPLGLHSALEHLFSHSTGLCCTAVFWTGDPRRHLRSLVFGCQPTCPAKPHSRMGITATVRTIQLSRAHAHTHTRTHTHTHTHTQIVSAWKNRHQPQSICNLLLHRERWSG